MSAAVFAVAHGLPACLPVFSLSYGLFSHHRIPKGDQNVLATPPEMAHGAAERLSDRDAELSRAWMNLSGIPAQSCAPNGGTDYKLTAKSSSTAERLGGKRNALLLLSPHPSPLD